MLPDLRAHQQTYLMHVSGHSLKCISQSSLSAKVIVTCLFKLDFSGFVLDMYDGDKAVFQHWWMLIRKKVNLAAWLPIATLPN